MNVAALAQLGGASAASLFADGFDGIEAPDR